MQLKIINILKITSQNGSIKIINEKNEYSKSLDKRKKIYKLLDKQGGMFESEKIKEHKLAEWIEKYVAGRGYKINHNASQLLSEYLGTDLSKVVNAVNIGRKSAVAHRHHARNPRANPALNAIYEPTD